MNSRQRMEQLEKDGAADREWKSRLDDGTAGSGWEKQEEDNTAGRDWNSRQWMEQQAVD